MPSWAVEMNWNRLWYTVDALPLINMKMLLCGK